MTSDRYAEVKRETVETNILIELIIDGVGEYSIDTGEPMFDHMLAQLSKHGLLDLKVTAQFV